MTHGSQTHYYDAFGLTIASEVSLNELRPAEPTPDPDLTISLGEIGRPRPAGNEGDYMDFDSPEGVFMVWRSVAGILVKDEGTVIVEPYPDVEERVLAFPILGPVMAWILHLHEYFLLHASAIDVNGQTLVLMGDKLAGKSTTAAAFVRAGYPLVTDDLVAVDLQEGAGSRIMPAFAQLKLADDAAATIRIEGAEALPLVMDGFPKRQHRLSAMRSDPVSIDWCVVLERGGSEPGLIRFDPGQAIGALNRYSYLPRFSDRNWTSAEEADHFRNCAKLAGSTRVGRLSVPVGLDRLDETVAFMVKTFEEERA